MARKNIFRFKRFSVVNEKTAMKVGTDGVLIGAWCDVTEAQRVVDVGTGCGLIALMIAQRNCDAHITAIDIDQDAIDEATTNFAASPWSDRLCALCADYNDYDPQEKYDLIVSNPPFFSNGIMAPEKGRNQARHSVTLSIEQLIDNSLPLLADDGILSFISPVDDEMSIRRCVVTAGMSIKRLARVVPVEGAAPKRLMWELLKQRVNSQEEQIIITQSDGSYSEAYMALTHDFYLKM